MSLTASLSELRAIPSIPFTCVTKTEYFAGSLTQRNIFANTAFRYQRICFKNAIFSPTCNKAINIHEAFWVERSHKMKNISMRIAFVQTPNGASSFHERKKFSRARDIEVVTSENDGKRASSDNGWKSLIKERWRTVCRRKSETKKKCKIGTKVETWKLSRKVYQLGKCSIENLSC